MILESTLKKLLAEAPDRSGRSSWVSRTLVSELRLQSGLALVLLGVRRSGKSTLQSLLMQRGVGSVYLNFEDLRLHGMTPEDFPGLLEAVERTGRVEGGVFLDEVQEVPEWQRLVRAMLDKGWALCLTGSNASLLGKELGSKLTGRHMSHEVFPFAYSEYLAFRRQMPSLDSLKQHLWEGGFPGFLALGQPLLLQELLRDVVQRDIALRHGLREIRHLMNLVLHLYSTQGQAVSFQRLAKVLAVPSVGQVSRYIEFLQDAYLLLAVPKYSASFKQRVVAPMKYYAIDNGLRCAVSAGASPDLGRRLENALALALRRRGRPFHYAGESDVWECDFVTDAEAIQVCTELTPGNVERELRGLREARALPGPARRLLIITLDQTQRLTIDASEVEVVPAWRWLD